MKKVANKSLAMILIVVMLLSVGPLQAAQAAISKQSTGSSANLPSLIGGLASLGETYEVDWEIYNDSELPDVLLEPEPEATPDTYPDPVEETQQPQDDNDSVQSTIEPFNTDIMLLFADEDFVYTTSGGSATITGYNGSATDVIIPETLGDLSVMAIGNSAFSGNRDIITVVFPNSMRTVGQSAFRDCIRLQSITLNNGLTTIDAGAFYGCSALETLTIPNSVTTVNSGSSASGTFGGCTSLTTVSTGSGLREIQQYTFYGCTSLVSATIGNAVTSVGYYGFWGCKQLSNVTFGNAISSIGDYAFQSCESLTSVSFPGSMRTLGRDAFRDCARLQSVTLNNGLTTIGQGAFYGCSSIPALVIPDSVTAINSGSGAGAFQGCSGIVTVSIGSGLREIQTYTFYGCSELASVTIGDAVTSIGAYAFWGCAQLSGLSFGSVANAIGDYAFQNCASLTEVTLPASMRTIGVQSFRGCTSLRVIALNSGLTTIGSGAFYSCSSLKSLVIPDSVTTINSSSGASGTFSGCISLTTVTIGGGLREIQPYTFYGCTELVSIGIGNAVTSIGNYAFYSCSQLSGLTFGSAATTIGDYAFQNCESLTTLALPNSMRTIGRESFRGCTRLRTVTLNSGLTTINAGAFYGCSLIQTLAIPDSVTTINSETGTGGGAFRGCTSLTSVIIGSGLREIQTYTFFGCTELVSVTIGNAVTSIGDYAFRDCAQMSGLTLSNAITAIGNYAFQNCTSLTAINLPSSMRTIGQQAFRDCIRLQNVTLNDGLTTIGSGAFYGCSALKTLNIPNSVTTINSNSTGTFQGCTSLTAVTIGSGLREIQTYAFYGCTELVSVTIGNAAASIGDYAFYNCTQLSVLSFGSEVASIGDYAFLNCASLTTATLPGSMRTIGREAFRGCIRLRSVAINNGLTTIGSGAFFGCNLLQALNIPDSVTSINSNSGTYGGAFRGCTGLTSVTLGNGLREIQPYTFYGCTELASVTIGNNVTSIGTYAFYNARLQLISLPNAVTTVSSNAFQNCRTLMTVSLGSGMQIISDYAFDDCTSLRSLNFATAPSLRTIGSYAFRNCISLPNIVLPNAVTTIGTGAFQGCRGFTQVQIGNMVTSIGDNAFRDCIDVKEVYIGSNVRTIGSAAFQNNTSLETIVIGPAVVSIGNSAFRGDTRLQTVEFTSTVQQIGVSAFEGCTKLLSATIPPNVWKFGDGINAGTAAGTNIFRNTAPGFTVIGVPGSPADEFAMNNGYLFAALGEYITLDVDETTNKAVINVSGSAPKGKVVSIYDGSTKIGEFTANVNRRYGGNVTMVGGFGARVIRAEIAGEDGGTLSATKTVLYEQNAPRLAEFAMYHDGQRIDLMTSEGIRQTLIFRQGSPFTFEVKIENSDQIKEMHIRSERNGVSKYMKAIYDAGKNVWVASGFFDPTDTWYVPGKLSIGYLEKYEPSPVELNPSITVEQVASIYSSLSPEWKNANTEVLVDTEQRTEILITLADEKQTEIGIIRESKTSVKTEAQLLAEGFEKLATTDGSYIYAIVEVILPRGRALDFDDNGYVRVRTIDLKTGIETGVSVGGIGLGEAVGKIGGEVAGKVFGSVFGVAETAYTIYDRYGDYQRISGNIANNQNLTQPQRTEAQRRLDNVHAANQISNVVIGAVGIGLGLALGGWVGVVAGLAVVGVGYLVNLLYDYAYAGINNGAHQIRVAVDPSGYVYEAVTSNRLPGVTVTAYHKGETPEDGTMDDGIFKWNAAEFDQANPLLTDREGRYAWDVPEGLWQVKAELNGYETAYSTDLYGWLPVPPPQLEVHIGMMSKAAPEIAWFNIYDTYADVEFTKYMKPETVDSLTLKAPGGAVVAYALEYPQDENSHDGAVYAKRYRLVYSNDYIATAGSYTLTTSADILSYADVSTKVDTKTAELAPPVSLIVPDNVTIEYGATKSINITIKNYNPSKPLTLTAESDFGFIAEVINVSAIDADGKATVTVSGNLPGGANIILRIAEKGVEVTLPVWVNMLDDMAGILISPKETTVPKGGTHQFTATDEATGGAAAVTWSLSGNLSTGTKISETGLLTVAGDEIAATLTITVVASDGSARYNTATVYVTPTSSFLLGDVNGDGELDIGDVNLLYMYIRGKAMLTGDALLAADVNDDGDIDIGDVNMLYMYIRGKIPSIG